MKRVLLPAFFLAAAFFARLSGQTTLVAGDLIFTGMYTNAASGTPDQFAFILLTPVAANTTIYFSDRGWNGTTWQGAGGTEGTVRWITGSALPARAEIMISGLGSGAATWNGVANGNVTQVLGGNAVSGLSVGNGGDQLFAFQGGAGDPTAGGVVRIAGIHFSNCTGTSDAAWDPPACASGPSASALPAGLVGGFSAFWTGAFQTQGKFSSCSGVPYANTLALRNAVMNRANWTFSNDQFTYIVGPPSSCSFVTLPLTLLDFNAVKNGNDWELKWKTADEVNTSKFDIEHSADGSSFTTIGSVAASPSGGSVNYYSYRLASVSGRDYCRLKMIDRDQTFTYSKTISILDPVAVNDAYRVYPNPVKNEVFISGSQSAAERISIDLMDLNGRVIASKQIKGSQIVNQAVMFNTAQLLSGIYILRVSEDEGKKKLFFKIMK